MRLCWCIRTLTGCSEDYPNSSGTLSPETTAQALELRAAQCHAYHRLLRQHLLEQEHLEAGRWRDRAQQARAQRERNAESALRAAVTVQAAWRGVCGRRLAARRREGRRKCQQMKDAAATRIQVLHKRGYCVHEILM